ncbi:MAG: flagellar filament capping protein FliD [Sporomusaceae bacterium]|nr:flagellar filament capping protein FliD [Sporomusaceae bacterium]
MAMRTYGLSGSGMDVDQLVKDLMKARRATYDKVWQQKTQTEWKKQDYNTIYTLINDLRDKTLYDFRKQSTLSPKQVASSNDSIVSASANGEAVNIDHSIAVKELATGVKMISREGVTPAGKYKEGTLQEQFGDGVVPEKLEFKINGKDIKLNVTESTKLNDVVVAINQAGAGVKASYDYTLDRFFLYSEKTGSEATVDFAGSSEDSLKFLFDTLKLGDANYSSSTQLKQTGSDAQVIIDGVSLTHASNTFTVSGVTYNLKAKSLTDPDNGDPMPVTIAVKADIEKTIDTVQAFVETYNAFITTINNELKEDRNRDYMPLTDSQKSDMKDSDIAAYTQKAKSGMLRHDQTLSSLLSNLRLSFSSPIQGVAGKYNSASSIGIETGKYIDSDGNINSESDNGGKIYIDEDTLREALEEDPDAVYKIFGGTGDSSETTGVANRLFQELYNTRDQLRTLSGTPNSVDSQSVLAKRLTDYTERLTVMERQLQMQQERYYKQFDAMEAAISKMNQQSTWLTQQFSQG